MMMPSSAYPHVKSFASGDVGVKSPYPTVVAVTITHQKQAGMESKGVNSTSSPIKFGRT